LAEGDGAGAIERQIEATEVEIDRVVYDLYSLTKEEIAIVDQATSRQETR
jgi:hypothetical protein